MGLAATVTLEAEPESDSEMKMRYILKFPEKNLLSHLKSFSHTLNIEPMS